MSFASLVQSPTTLNDAFEILSERKGPIKIIAGGTDLMVLMNAHQLEAPEFLDIWKVDELRGVTEEENALRIGALTTYTQLIRSKAVQRFVPSLVSSSRTIGAVQIQNRGTLGGNIVNASPAGDTLPVLAAYDAELEVGSARGIRTVRFNEFYTGYRATVLEPDELLISVRIPKLREDERDFFCKVGTRRAQAISKTVLATRVRMTGKVLEKISIGVGSVAPTVVRVTQTERLLNGSTVSPKVIEEARQMIALEISPITDLRSTEHYRRTVTSNVLARLLNELIA
ncbi:MAG TPA: xanthine dehydrogenase family protein subunit M [Blastocatellia bacterium]|nr:xanthine dehydrogenase family protein subunit M [Blastocatellia bacterium]